MQPNYNCISFPCISNFFQHFYVLRFLKFLVEYLFILCNLLFTQYCIRDSFLPIHVVLVYFHCYKVFHGMNIPIQLSTCLLMDIQIISNLFALLNNAVVRILEHISLCLCLRISVGYKRRRQLLSQRICICSTLLKILQNKWISILYLAIYDFLCATFLPTIVTISLFIFIKLMGISHYDININFHNYQQSLSSSHVYWPIKFLLL